MIKKILLLFLIFFSFSQINLSFADNDFLGEKKIKNDLKGSEKPLIETISSYIGYLLTFLYFMAVVYGLYGGFQIFTATDDDEKVKKGKTIIIQSIIGLVLIFLAGPIASFFLGNSDNGETGLLNKTKSSSP